MQLEYHAEAAAKGVYVIGSCGFDSIPADLGIVYTQRQFKGRNRTTSQRWWVMMELIGMKGASSKTRKQFE